MSVTTVTKHIGEGFAKGELARIFDFDTTNGVETKDMRFNTFYKQYFRDTGLYVYSSTDGQLDVIGDTKIQITAPTIALTGSTALTLSGAMTMDGRLTWTNTVTTSGSTLYLALTSSATSGNVYGFRLFVSSTDTSGTAGHTRGIRCEADMGAGAKATLLEAGLFTAKVSSGTATVTNIRALTGHISIGDTLIVSGDVCAINAHIQTRGNEDITGTHCGVYIKNEAVGGNGITLDSALYVTEASLGGGEKGYGVLIDCSTATLDVHDTDRVTLIKFKDSAGTVRKLVFDPTNNTVVAVQT